jgi:hypothetical protein
VASDIFEKAPNRSNCPDMLSDIGPQVSWVFFAFSLPCATEWLTWISSNDPVYFSSKDSCREGFKIRVDRGVIHPPFFNLRKNVGLDEGFDLHIADCSNIHARSSKSKFNPSVSCTKADNVLGIIHISSSYS